MVIPIKQAAGPCGPAVQTASEIQLDAELELPRRALDRRDLSRGGDHARRTEHRRARQPEVRTVGDVESFHTELQAPRAHDREVLEDRHVPRREAGPAHRVATEVANGA